MGKNYFIISRSKRYVSLLKLVFTSFSHDPIFAINKAIETANVKFTESFEAHVRLCFASKYPDQLFKATLKLLNGIGNIPLVAVIAEEEKIAKVIVANADTVGA